MCKKEAHIKALREFLNSEVKCIKCGDTKFIAGKEGVEYDSQLILICVSCGNYYIPDIFKTIPLDKINSPANEDSLNKTPKPKTLRELHDEYVTCRHCGSIDFEVKWNYNEADDQNIMICFHCGELYPT